METLQARYEATQKHNEDKFTSTEEAMLKLQGLQIRTVGSTKAMFADLKNIMTQQATNHATMFEQHSTHNAKLLEEITEQLRGLRKQPAEASTGGEEKRLRTGNEDTLRGDGQ